MNTYEIERKLGDKADKFELHSLQTENRELKSHVNELERKIVYLESTNSNRYYALERIFNMMAEHPQFSDLQDEIYQLKGSLQPCIYPMLALKTTNNNTTSPVVC